MAKESGGQAGDKKAAVQTEGRWARWGRSAFDKSIKVSDFVSPYANKVSSAVGGERFWPQSNDMPLEIEKCERILRAFTVEGIQQKKEEKEEQVKDAQGNWIRKKVRVLRKIPPAAIRNAKGIAIYSSMRSGIAPLGGGGGSGVFMARLPDGSWSAPSAISPQSGAVGLLLGIDFLDVILLINSDKTIETFKSHRIDLGAETGITAGPYGTGYSAEASYDRAPVYSYVRNRGAYAGAEVIGQVFLHRFDENERFYYWPGISAGDILTGKVRTIPPVVAPLHRALRDAETGRAQGGKLDRTEFDIVKVPESDVFKQLGPNYTPTTRRSVAPSQLSTPRSEKSAAQLVGTEVQNGDVQENGGDRESLEELDLEGAAKSAERQLVKGEQKEFVEEDEDHELVRDGERLRLPPTPAELEMMEAAGIPDEEDLRFAQMERVKVYELPPPPMHPDVVRHWSVHPTMSQARPNGQLKMDGLRSPDIREAQLVALPISPLFERDTTLDSQDAAFFHAEFEKNEPTQRMEGDAEGVVLAKGVADETRADEIMEAAIEGGVVEKHITTAEDVDDAAHNLDRYRTESRDEHVASEQVGSDSEGTREEYLDANRTDESIDHSVNTSHSRFASINHTPTMSQGESPFTPDTDAIGSSSPQVEDTEVPGAEEVSKLQEGDEEKKGAEPIGDEHESHESPRPTTPTDKMDTEASGVDTPTGVQTPTTEAGSTSTPSRPPRRKRPPQKKK